ncbi:integrating conjugative element protein, PFL_4709 family [Vibrio xiamenensis]|uniref:Integrating conjugative element protein, PFL_4709 family n=1 Tax=Vibrio xiamenensis TaxID=861298 RepID=A0A1G8FHN5_9VIBR|nr:DUF1525 domain-containing protein [Vibrio xiamenensis]SDH81677.1 integrating conjugative element protein, PFL_4709 family [Vibrio xiamenensis]
MKRLSVFLLSISTAASVSAGGLKLDVFVDSSTDYIVPANRSIKAFNVHRVDQLSMTEKSISSQLPDNEAEAKTFLEDFVQSGGIDQHIVGVMDGYASINKAVRLGISKVPAIVINDRYVAYGMGPEKAIQFYEQYVSRYGYE